HSGRRWPPRTPRKRGPNRGGAAGRRPGTAPRECGSSRRVVPCLLVLTCPYIQLAPRSIAPSDPLTAMSSSLPSTTGRSPAQLKNAIDQAYTEWLRKPFSALAYGIAG